jgi:hypothetical protein
MFKTLNKDQLSASCLSAQAASLAPSTLQCLSVESARGTSDRALIEQHWSPQP